MSRTVYLDLAESEIIGRCLKKRIGISAIERLPSGGARLVCMSVDGAQQIRSLLRSKVLEGERTIRARHRPITPLW